MEQLDRAAARALLPRRGRKALAVASRKLAQKRYDKHITILT